MEILNNYKWIYTSNHNKYSWTGSNKQVVTKCIWAGKKIKAQIVRTRNQTKQFLKQFPTTMSFLIHHRIQQLGHASMFYYDQTKSVLQLKYIAFCPSPGKTQMLHKPTCPSLRSPPS